MNESDVIFIDWGRLGSSHPISALLLTFDSHDISSFDFHFSFGNPIRNYAHIFQYNICALFSSYFKKNYDTLKTLNPSLPLLLRTTTNAMPAITTELQFTTNDLLAYMIQNNKFQNEDGSPAVERIEAAKKYLNDVDWQALAYERFASPGFDPEHPYIDEVDPDWKLDPVKSNDLEKYIAIKDEVDLLLEIIKSGPNGEYQRAENSLLMCQRVDLWCAGEDEVESALRHLYLLGRRFNGVEQGKHDIKPEFITEFYPGASDF